MISSRNDETSAKLLEEVIVSLSDKLTYRIKLGGLDTTAVGNIVSSYLGGAQIDSSFIEKLTAVSDGNPFVIGEYVRSLCDAGNFTLSAGEWTVTESGISSLELGQDVIELVINRLKNLEDNQLDLFSTAAVLGMTWSVTQVINVSGFNEDYVCRTIQEGVKRSLIECIDKFGLFVLQPYTFLNHRA